MSFFILSVSACAASFNVGAKKFTALDAFKYIKKTGPNCKAERIRRFLRHGVDVNAAVDDTPLLYYALLKGADDCALALLRSGASVSFQVITGPFLNSALSLTAGAVACKPAVINALINRNAELNNVTLDTTPLLSAALAKNVACAKVLIQAGGNVGRPVPPRGLTPLMVAQATTLLANGSPKKSSKRVAMTKLLLSRGADPNVRTKNVSDRTGEAGITALFFAVGAGPSSIPCAECARLLIAAGADPNLTNQAGQTPLLWSLSPKRETTLAAVEALVDGGADINLANYKTGETPLMAAAVKGDEKIVHYLLEHGANCCAKDNEDQTAVDYAYKAHHEKIVELLEFHADE